MTFRSLTCFNLASAVFVFVAAAQAATVSGSVNLLDSREPAVRKSGDRSGVIVWLQPLNDQARAASDAQPKRAVIDQKNKRFVPHVLPIQVGTEVSFPNSDPIFHNAFSTFDGQVFDVGLYPPATTRAVRFRRPGAVRVFCNIHHEMSAIIVVLPVPWFATTARDGTFAIHQVPPGDYTVSVFHERATKEALQKLRRRVRVDASGAIHDIGAIAVSESGYLPVPHRNKYGHDYDPTEQQSYTGRRK